MEGGWQGESQAQLQPCKAGGRGAAPGVSGALPPLAGLRRVLPRGRRRRGRFLLLTGTGSRTDLGGAVPAAAPGTVPRARAPSGPRAALGHPAQPEASRHRRTPRQGASRLRVWACGRRSQEAKGHEEVELR